MFPLAAWLMVFDDCLLRLYLRKMASNIVSSKLQKSGLGTKPKSASAADVRSQIGLTSVEARRLLETFGQNAMPDTSMHPLRMAIEKFWAPVPWMLEAAIILEPVLGKYVEAAPSCSEKRLTRRARITGQSRQ
jgi:Cation transporter/ATPase, N-terminus